MLIYLCVILIEIGKSFLVLLGGDFWEFRLKFDEVQVIFYSVQNCPPPTPLIIPLLPLLTSPLPHLSTSSSSPSPPIPPPHLTSSSPHPLLTSAPPPPPTHSLTS